MPSERIASNARASLDFWLWVLTLQFLLGTMIELAQIEWRPMLSRLLSGNVPLLIFVTLLCLYLSGGVVLLLWRRRAGLAWVQLALWLPLLVDLTLSLSLHLRAMTWWAMPLELVRDLSLVMPAIGWTAFLNSSPRVAGCYPRHGEITATWSSGSSSLRKSRAGKSSALWQRYAGIWSGDLPRRMLIVYGLVMLGSLVLPRDYIGVMTWRWQGPPDSDLAMVLRDWQDLSQFVLPGLAALLLLFWRRWPSIQVVATCLWLAPIGRLLVVVFMDHRPWVDVLTGTAIDRSALLLAIAWSAYLFNAKHLRRLYSDGDGENKMVTDVDAG